MKRKKQSQPTHPITTHRHDLLNLWRKPVFPERSLNGGWVSHVTSKHGNAMVAKKLLVDDKIPACVKEIMSPGCYKLCKVSNTQTLSFETFCVLEKSLLSLFTFCTSSNLLFFMSCWLAHNQLSWNVLLFSCNLIGQLCLSGPGYSNHTVSGPA